MLGFGLLSLPAQHSQEQRAELVEEVRSTGRDARSLLTQVAHA